MSSEEMNTNIEITAAIITSLFAIIIALFSAFASYITQTRATKLEHQLAEQREAKSAEAQAKLLISKYRNPLLWAAYDLQSRLYNIVNKENRFIQYYYHLPKYTEYSINNTLYVIAEFLGWIEILRREIQFLDLGDAQANRKLNELLTNINQAFSSDKIAGVFRLFRGEQRAIGELMLAERYSTKGLECIGFAEFSRNLEDPEFARWFSRLRDEIQILAKEPEKHEERLIEIQHRLIDLIDFLDPDHKQIVTKYRSRISSNQ